jgi:hypothetical protein
MGRYRPGVAVNEVPAGTLDEHWWRYLADLGSYDLGGLPSGGAVAIRNEWERLDSTDVPISERAEMLIAFCVGLGAKAWAVRARVQVGRASARRRADNSQAGLARRLAADERRRRLSSTNPTKRTT